MGDIFWCRKSCLLALLLSIPANTHFHLEPAVSVHFQLSLLNVWQALDITVANVFSGTSFAAHIHPSNLTKVQKKIMVGRRVSHFKKIKVFGRCFGLSRSCIKIGKMPQGA